jgi:hypothetical protein
MQADPLGTGSHAAHENNEKMGLEHECVCRGGSGVGFFLWECDVVDSSDQRVTVVERGSERC